MLVELDQEGTEGGVVCQALRERPILLDAERNVDDVDPAADAIERAEIDGCVLSFCVLVHRVVVMGYSNSIVRNGGASPAAARASR